MICFEQKGYNFFSIDVKETIHYLKEEVKRKKGTKIGNTGNLPAADHGSFDGGRCNFEQKEVFDGEQCERAFHCADPCGSTCKHDCIDAASVFS